MKTAPAKKRQAKPPVKTDPYEGFMRTCHLMTDLETMSTAKHAAIVSIGSVLFDPRAEDSEETIRADPSRIFYTTISLDSNEREGRHISASTVAWWLRQSEQARSALLEAPSNLRQALTQWRMWLQAASPMPTRIWAKSPEFDVVVLQSAFAQIGDLWPFKYWESRDVRTITEAAYPDGDEPKIGTGTAHNAIDDSIRQVLMVQHCHHVIHKLRTSA